MSFSSLPLYRRRVVDLDVLVRGALLLTEEEDLVEVLVARGTEVEAEAFGPVPPPENPRGLKV